VEHYVGIDVSLERSSVRVVDGRGKIVKEAKVASEPEALVYFFKELGFPVNRIGFEAGPLSQWLHAGLTQAGFETVLLETRHVKAALSAMTRLNTITRARARTADKTRSRGFMAIELFYFPQIGHPVLD
jgi:transposase